MYAMKLTVAEFVARAEHLYRDLEESFRLVYGNRPGESEVNSWRYSLPQLARVLALSTDGVLQADIYLEYSMPSSSARADALIVGLNADRRRVGVIIELKQWDARSIVVDGQLLKVGPGWHTHPSDQALGYRDYLADLSVAFADQNVVLRSCSFLHNVPKQALAPLSRGQFQRLVEVAPMFGGDMRQEMATWLSTQLAGAPDSRFTEEMESDEVRVSKALFATVAKAVREERAWQLLESQRTAYERILALAIRDDGEKHLVLVTGGPGTGKSVVAMQLFGELNRREIPAVHVTNSSSFTTVMRSLIAAPRSQRWGSGATNGLLRLSHNWVKSKPKFEVAVADEAHRFRTKTTFYPNLVSNRPQAEEVMENVRVFVAFVDEKQILRKAEAGTLDYFRACALAVGVRPENIHGPIELQAQFRSAGSLDFVEALDSALYDELPKGFCHPRFRTHVFDSVEDLEGHLLEQVEAGDSARLVAGFCWPWSNPLPDGSLVADVQVGSWCRPWNRKAVRASYPPDSHPYTLWARNVTDELGEVGCIYSAQGFEFDHVGVIWCEDLVWRKDRWVAQPHKSHDGEMVSRRGVTSPEVALPLLKNAYRVLSSRGMKSTSFFCLDEETRDYLRSAFSMPAFDYRSLGGSGSYQHFG